MNAYIENYIKQAAALFPIVGKMEKSYLIQLAQSIEDYFHEAEPDSLDVIIHAFGLPQSVIRDYLAYSDTKHIVKRIRVRKFTRLCAMTALSLCLMTALLTAVHFGWRLKALHDVEEYTLPVYSSEGTIAE